MKTSLLRSFALDVRSLALFRVTIGILLLCDLSLRALDFPFQALDSGAYSFSSFLQMLDDEKTWSLYALSSSDLWAWLLLGLNFVTVVFFTVGKWTRTSHVLLFVLYSSLHVRNPHILDRGDIILRLQLFWSIFLPLGAAWSFDAQKKSPALNPRVSFPGIIFILQLFLMYWVSVVFKTHPDWIGNGSAILKAVSHDFFRRDLIAQFLVQFPETLALMTKGTYFFELFVPLLFFFPRFRTPVVLSFFLFHLGLFLCLRLGLFPWFVMSIWLGVLPGSFWQKRSQGEVSKVQIDQSALRDAFVFLLFFWVLLWNRETIIRFPAPAQTLPLNFQYVGRWFGLQQIWNMFAPIPGEDRGWIYTRILDEENRNLQPPEEVSLEAERREFFQSLQRRRKFYVHLLEKDETLIVSYARHRCLQIGAAQKNAQVELWWFRPPASISSEKILLLIRHHCLEDLNTSSENH